MTDLTTQPRAIVEAIRQAEMEANRRLAAEHDLSAERLAAARQSAEARLAAAAAAGQIEGEAHHQAARRQAEAEAAELVAQARRQAEVLHQSGDTIMPQIVALALRFVLDGDHAP